MIYEHWKQVPRSFRNWPWQYFTPEEVACRGTGSVLVVPEFLDRLDNLRSLINSPLRVLSAYRSSYHNARVGGAVFSKHLRGIACDLSTTGHDKKEMIRIAKNVGFTGFGVNYSTFLHIDLGRAREW